MARRPLLILRHHQQSSRCSARCPPHFLAIPRDCCCGAAHPLQATHQAELSRLRAAAAAAAADADAAAAALEGVHGQLAGAAAVSADLDSLEARFWFELGAHGAELEQHLTERDALLRRIEAAGQQLLLLQGSHVLNDAFCIWHSGPFGTISGLRLGRTPEIPVDWDEINAAWGQAVLLLHTMAQQCQLTFSSEWALLQQRLATGAVANCRCCCCCRCCMWMLSLAPS